jgi:hypothetical protein
MLLLLERRDLHANDLPRSLTSPDAKALTAVAASSAAMRGHADGQSCPCDVYLRTCMRLQTST